MKSQTTDSDSISNRPSTLERSDYLSKIGQRKGPTIEKRLPYNGENFPHNLEKIGSTDESNNKHHLEHGQSGLSEYERKRDLGHNPKGHDKHYSKLVSPTSDKQRGNEISSTIDPLNIHHIVDLLSPQDYGVDNLTKSKG